MLVIDRLALAKQGDYGIGSVRPSVCVFADALRAELIDLAFNLNLAFWNKLDLAIGPKGLKIYINFLLAYTEAYNISKERINIFFRPSGPTAQLSLFQKAKFKRAFVIFI